MNRKTQQIMLAIFLVAGCSGSGTTNQVNSGATSPDSGETSTTINLTPGQSNPSDTCTCPCPDGTTGTKACIPAKIFKAMPRRSELQDIVTPDGCTCPSPKPDGGTPSPDTIAIQPDATLAPDTTEPPPIMADAAPVPPTAQTPDAGMPKFPTSLPVDAPVGQPDTGSLFPTSLPGPDVAPPQVTIMPDAMIITPDTAMPDTRVIPDTAPPVIIPDAMPDRQPDNQPDLGLDTTPDTMLPVDIYIAPDLQPDTRPDTKPDCGCTEKKDAAPACWHKTPWTGNITLTLQTCGGVKVEWRPEDCSSNGYKVVWIRYSEDEHGNIDLPSYPNNADGFKYVGNVTDYTIEGLDTGKWTVRVYKYPPEGGGTEGEYSTPAFITIP